MFIHCFKTFSNQTLWELQNCEENNMSTVCAHCTSNKNRHALMVFNGNRFRHTASSVQVNLEEKRMEVRKAVIITKQRQRLREKHIELPLTVPYCK